MKREVNTLALVTFGLLRILLPCLKQQVSGTGARPGIYKEWLTWLSTITQAEK